MNDAYDAQRSAMTRLRLLASTSIVAAAEEVLVADRQACDAVFGQDSVQVPHGQLPAEEDWRALQGNRQVARQALLNAFRASTELGPAKPLVWPLGRQSNGSL
jgi:hypothetical protein